MDCPDFDFFWRPGEPGLLSYFTHFVAPPDKEGWVSVVAPMETYFDYSPMPIQEPFVRYAFFGDLYRYSWTPVIGRWNFGEGDTVTTLALWDILVPRTHSYAHSSYGKPETNPKGEPGYPVMGEVTWIGMVSFWGCKWGFAWCPWVPGGYARVQQHHVVPVRQILPVTIGD